ncbi:Protein BFR2 [Neonectria ditissima]|uniref:Protein BFR2 n=1 Tax=Neonectria ditissima TaxID=78410 RepID=A0A0P7BHH4_9HYPO|nr:Protein BFR2 [Neonectria ditissima]
MNLFVNLSLDFVDAFIGLAPKVLRFTDVDSTMELSHSAMRHRLKVRGPNPENFQRGGLFMAQVYTGNSQMTTTMATSKSRAKQFQEQDEHISKDHDPEANIEASDPESGSESSDNENDGTEHYVSVGKSKLRDKEGVSLGPQYRGARVTRQALDQESDDEDDDDAAAEGSSDDDEFDDPVTANLELDTAKASDSEISSDNALAESDDERFQNFAFRGSSKPKTPAGEPKSRATAADFMSSDDDAGGSGAEADEDEDEDDMSGAELDESGEDDDMDDGLDALVNGGADSDDVSEENGDEDDDEDDDEDEDEDDESENDDNDSKKKKKQAAKPALATLSNRADVDKGVAIQQQRKLYDGLLNLRIRLQKALIAANTFATIEDSPEPESEPYEAAEEAAIKLLNTISSLKDNFGSSSRAGDKRKRELDVSLASEEIWNQIQEEEERSVKFREDRLEKWARKVQTANVTTAKGLGSRNKTLISALQEQLTNPENRLAKRSRVPRSCAPAQAAKGLTEDEDIYDDADFYQVLLKELVDQRTVESASAQSAVATVMMTVAKEAKMRKNVDRKASKGRKMRFTVHEKLQNFMAPEDRRAWEQSAIDRLFGTLFGRKMELNENESDDDMVDAEEAGLRLFRN